MNKGKKSFEILVLPGDGIGPEITNEALKVLKAVSSAFGLSFDFTEALCGGVAIDKEGAPISRETMDMAGRADAILLGAVGGPEWDDLPTEKRPERGLLALRAELDMYANLRPAKVFEPLSNASTLKREVVHGIDLLVVRELVSDIYFGQPRGIDRTSEGREGFNTMRYTDKQIERVVRFAFEMAKKRRNKLTSVDKANVLETMALWREVVMEVAKDYPEVELDHQFVDNCSMQLIRNPSQFDVMVMGNMFGDILSDESAMLTGSIGMLPSASVGGKSAMYEPIHGSAPDIAGQGKANPMAMILSAAMMLEMSCQALEAAKAVHRAVEEVLDEGYRTGDLLPTLLDHRTFSLSDTVWNEAGDAVRLVSCSEMGSLVADRVRAD
jgi:3-isopropylmalate dehydrogenase